MAKVKLEDFGKNWPKHAMKDSLDHHFRHAKAHKEQVTQIVDAQREVNKQKAEAMREGKKGAVRSANAQMAKLDQRRQDHEKWHAAHYGKIHEQLQEL